MVYSIYADENIHASPEASKKKKTLRLSVPSARTSNSDGYNRLQQLLNDSKKKRRWIYSNTIEIVCSSTWHNINSAPTKAPRSDFRFRSVITWIQQIPKLEQWHQRMPYRNFVSFHFSFHFFRCMGLRPEWELIQLLEVSSWGHSLFSESALTDGACIAAIFRGGAQLTYTLDSSSLK